ncbi:hypothetical protein SK128_026664 [Halocaridina rubra]|uniref:Vps16 C-terminal domain-containing protein n=1 Tax=Halocaridina rubra TaxID=373956 RepID=A0AAN9ADZ1_HALRR
MNRAENDAYWGSTDTASSVLDNFFDEDSDVGWYGYSSDFNIAAKSTTATTPRVSKNDTHSSSIVDNIISSSSSTHSISEGLSGDLDNVSVSSGKLTKNVRAIGEKLDSWKPPSVSIKWNTQGSGSEACMHCESKTEEIIQLKKRLENSYSRYNFTLPPDDMVNRIILGQPYSLENYRSLEDKLALIDTALGTFDSSVIFVTVLHLKNTVKKSIFIKEMQSRAHAVQVYVHYLKQRYNYTEAIDFLGSLGRHEEAAILTYKWTLSGKSPSLKVKNMTKSLQSHFSDPALAFESNMVKEHAKLIEQQIAIEEKDNGERSSQMLSEYPPESSIIESSLLDTLLYCSKYHWDVSESHIASPVALRKSHAISERQVLWTVLRGRAQVNHWPLPSDLDAWMGSKGLIGALSSLKSALSGVGRVVKATLPVDQVVYMLHGANAPPNVLAAYITLVDSLDLRLKLAVNCKSHQAVIEVYIALKDRDALEKYLKEIPVGSPEYVKAENALKAVRWKT